LSFHAETKLEPSLITVAGRDASRCSLCPTVVNLALRKFER